MVDTGEKEEAVLSFKYLPAYANFLLGNKMDELAVKQLELSRNVKLPMLRFFQHLPESELIELGKQSISELLSFLAQNNANGYIDEAAKKLDNNQLSGLSQHHIQPQDVTLSGFVRNSLFSRFLSQYTTDITVTIGVMNEVNEFSARLDTKCLTTLFNLQHRLSAQMQSLAKIGNWIWELDTGKYIWSEELYHIYELEPQEEMTYDIETFNHPDDADMIKGQMRTSRETLQPHDFQYRIVLKGGRQKTLHAKGQVQADENGVAIRMFGTLQDVTALQQKVDEIRKSEERYHKMVDEVKDYAILLMNKEGIIQNWNKGAQNIKGYSEEEIIGKYFGMFYTEKDRKNNLPQTLIELASTTGRATQEGWRVKKDGSLFWASVVITAMHDIEGKVTGFTKVTRDLTPKKILEDKMIQYAHQLEVKNAELLQSYKEVESFSYIASHDLQEPLRKIKTYAERILEKEQLAPTAKSYFDRILTSCSHMQNLINALLDYSRTNNNEAALEDVDLNTTVADIQSNLQETLEEKNGQVETSELPVIKGIPLQIYQLFFNIISNSIKYSRADVPPRIRISAETVEGDKLLPDVEGSFHKISVTDNGIGFEQQYAEKIFELFQRLHGKSQYAGTGIGLAICKKIVQNHNGYIKAIGEPGKGATFHIFLPQNPQA